MADVRFCVGFSKACKQAREGGGLPGYEGGLTGKLLIRPRRLWLPPDIVRLIDSMVRRLEHEDTLLSMNEGVLGTTLCQAAMAGGILDVRFLLVRGADVEATTVHLTEDGTEFPKTALRWAAAAGMLEVARALLDAGARELDLALHAASYGGHTPVVSLLLDRGVDVRYDGDTSLLNAVAHGHLATATLLLDRGADVHAQDDLALVYSAQRGHLEMVRLLLDRGADVHAQEDRPLRLAAQECHLEIVRLLLDRGANIHARNEEPLCWAIESGCIETVALLLDRGANIHIHHDRPLRVAARLGLLEMVRLLLDRGADIHAWNDVTLSEARRKGHAAVVALLLARGAQEPLVLTEDEAEEEEDG